tara:strand:+ start:676 stop:1563 length:888 start_codon:yes stop_codon:yes gene_type:complete
MKNKLFYIILLIQLSFSESTYNILDFSFNASSHSLHNGAIASSTKFLGINPASLSTKKNHFEFSYFNLPADIKSSNISLCWLNKKYIYFFKIHTTDYGLLKDDYNDTQFKAKDFSIELGHKFEYKNLLSFGLSLGYIRSTIDTYFSSGLYSNIGLRANVLNERFSFGTSLNHSGFQIQSFIDNIEKLPTSFRCGISYRPMYVPVNIYIDFINYFADFYKKIHFGLDFKIKQKINFRISTVNNKRDLNTEQYYKDILNNFSFGIGMNVKNKIFNLSIQNLGPVGIIYGFSILNEFN